MTYAGQFIWILGASSGIGEALARELARRGATLALTARRADALSALAQELGPLHLALPGDVTDFRSLQQMAGVLQQKFPRLDRVIVMAAIYSPPKRFEQTTHEDVRAIVDVNLNGTLNAVQAALPILLQQKTPSQLALCGSVAGYRGLPGGQPYSATKAAIINLAESLRSELPPAHIDVRIINPGFVRTPLTAKNDFIMPMMIEPDDAATAIAEGLQKRGFEIHFPKRFTFLVKLLQALPPSLYFAIARRIKRG
jgi:NAD(P)-dependent dehydrogenase (short-subunit alcohol dehydrogenase family)